jgi:hypothetical protein
MFGRAALHLTEILTEERLRYRYVALTLCECAGWECHLMCRKHIQMRDIHANVASRRQGAVCASWPSLVMDVHVPSTAARTLCPRE